MTDQLGRARSYVARALPSLSPLQQEELVASMVESWQQDQVEARGLLGIPDSILQEEWEKHD